MTINKKIMFSTPENHKISKTPGFARERLNSAPDRLRKSKKEDQSLFNREKILLETRNLSDLRLNRVTEEDFGDDDVFGDHDHDKCLESSRKFKCSICTKKFHHLNALEAHYLVHSMQNVHIEEDIPKCNICGKVYSSKMKLRLHQNKRHPIDSEILGVF